jgi:hypothetical protein
MLNPISSGTQARATAQSAAERPTTPQPKPQPVAAVKDTVQLRAAAKAIQATFQKAIETPAQTAKETAGGDRQAKRLLAKEAAAKANG